MTGEQAKVLKATYVAAEVVARMLKAGKKNSEITTAIEQVRSLAIKS